MSYVSRLGPYVMSVGYFDTAANLTSTHPATNYDIGVTAMTGDQGLVTNTGSSWVQPGGSPASNSLVREPTTQGTAGGIGALASPPSGDNNTAFGYNALTAATSGSQNTACGSQALGTNQTGTQNTAIGYNALQLNTGNYNNAFGFQALKANTSGSLNTGVGYQALQANTTGTNNNAIGFNAANKITTGTFNVVIGDAVASTTLVSGANNVLIGTTSNIDTAAAGTSNTIQIGAGSTAVISATGCGTPSTSVTSIAGLFGINGAVGSAQSTGWGTATGAAAQSNYSGSAATLAQTSAAVAQLITTLKAAGFLGT